MHAEDTAQCFASHMGLWAIQPRWMQTALQALQLGAWKSLASPSEAASSRDRPFALSSDGTALVRVEGQITKYPSKFGGTSTVLTRRILSQAIADPDVRSIMLAIDSPGGQVAGINDLAEAVRRATETKPVTAFIEDLGASAAYWVASQAQTIVATRTTEIGSIGVFAVLQDLSGAAEREGITIRVVSTGPFKGLGVSGTPVTQEMIDDVQAHVDQIGSFFFQAVQQGRRLNAKQLEAVTDGRVWLAAEAMQRGLIDRIGGFDDALIVAGSTKPRRRQTAEQRHAQLHAMREQLDGRS